MLRGQVISDDIPVENVRVVNASTNLEAITNALGKFNIIAKENDTLIFSGMLIATKVLHVSRQMTDWEFTVQLESQVNAIEEVVVQKYKLTGNLDADSKNIKVKAKDSVNINLNLGQISQMQFFDDNKSSPKNSSMPVMESTLTGIDFMAIGTGLVKLFSGPKKHKRPIVDFVTATKAKFPEKFFLQTLRLKPEQVDTFLRFCENWLKAQPIELYPHNEMALMEFLIAKREDFPDLK